MKILQIGLSDVVRVLSLQICWVTEASASLPSLLSCLLVLLLHCRIPPAISSVHLHLSMEPMRLVVRFLALCLFSLTSCCVRASPAKVWAYILIPHDMSKFDFRSRLPTVDVVKRTYYLAMVAKNRELPFLCYTSKQGLPLTLPLKAASNAYLTVSKHSKILTLTQR